MLKEALQFVEMGLSTVCIKHHLVSVLFLSQGLLNNQDFIFFFSCICQSA
jgi:hypothetical protein